MSLADLQSRGGFELLDVELARALGRMTDASSPDLELAIALTSRNVRRGHACFPIDLAAKDIWPADVAEAAPLPNATQWENALRESPLTKNGPLILDQKRRLYLRRYWELERDIAIELAARSSAPPLVASDPDWLGNALDRLFTTNEESLQRRAARNALQHRVSLLCGGPGTGKTTTVAAIVALLVEARLRQTEKAPEVLLLAPTGKSAVRLGEAVSHAKGSVRASDDVLAAIPEQATTVHRALGKLRTGMRFRRGEDLPLEAEIVVLDEASMIDLGLMRQLLQATPRSATLLIVGDSDQLTSVEAGSVLRDLVTASEETWWRDRVTHLRKTYRYDENQPLGQLVAAIRRGETAAVDELLADAGTNDITWSPSEQLQDEIDRAALHWSEVLSASEPAEHFRLRGRYVVLTPFRKGPIGTHQLSAAIQQRLGVQSAATMTPIIVEENNQELGVYNGDFGILLGATEGAPMATIQREPNRLQDIAEARLPRYSDAYALSVHKAQGSEFDEVLVVLPEEDAPLLTRELLYTAISRAKKRVRLVGPKEVIAAAIHRRARRYSGLVDAISWHGESDRLYPAK